MRPAIWPYKINHSNARGRCDLSNKSCLVSYQLTYSLRDRSFSLALLLLFSPFEATISSLSTRARESSTTLLAGVREMKHGSVKKHARDLSYNIYIYIYTYICSAVVAKMEDLKGDTLIVSGSHTMRTTVSLHPSFFFGSKARDLCHVARLYWINWFFGSRRQNGTKWIKRWFFEEVPSVWNLYFYIYIFIRDSFTGYCIMVIIK